MRLRKYLWTLYVSYLCHNEFIDGGNIEWYWRERNSRLCSDKSRPEFCHWNVDVKFTTVLRSTTWLPLRCRLPPVQNGAQGGPRLPLFQNEAAGYEFLHSKMEHEAYVSKPRSNHIIQSSERLIKYVMIERYVLFLYLYPCPWMTEY